MTTAEFLNRTFLEYGLPLVFANVLLQQFGLPIPAMPAIIVASAVAGEAGFSPLSVFAVALVACLIGNGTWYLLGRRFGARALKLTCSVSLAPDSCVRKASEQFHRWGRWTLILGKFIPGVSAVAIPIAGVMRMPARRFIALSTAGSVLWVGLSVAVGKLFEREVDEGVELTRRVGFVAALLVGLLLAAYIALKWWERRRFYKALRMSRVTVEELRALLDGDQKPFIVDVRNPVQRSLDGRSIPGAHAISLDEIEQQASRFPRDREIVFYCSCPHEASAAAAAKVLRDLGYKRVRPLLGGLDAWVEAGYAFAPIEVIDGIAGVP